ncbi:MAG: hypothetical protein ABJH52_14965 [Henriciella sp.]
MRCNIRPGSALAGILFSSAAIAPLANATEASNASLDGNSIYSLPGIDASAKAGLPERMLNAGLTTGSETVPAGTEVSFLTFWNYDHAVSFSSIRIFEATDTYLSNPIADLPFSKNEGASWVMPETGSGDYVYVLRVYDKVGMYDETVPKPLKKGTLSTGTQDRDAVINAVKSVDDTAVRNIQLRPIFRVKTPAPAKVVRAVSPVPIVEKIVEEAPAKAAPAPSLKPQPATRILVGQTYWDSAVSSSKPDRESDDVLRQSKVHVSFDGLDVQPLLNVGLVDGGASVVPGSAIQFETYWNYSHWIERAQIEVYDPNDPYIKAPLATLLVDPVTGRADWTVPAYRSTTNYTYVLKVFDRDGRFDETDQKHLALVSEKEELQLAPTAIAPTYGEDSTARRNIQISGGAVTVSGTGFEGQKLDSLNVMGAPVKADHQGDFAVQEILPTGTHSVDVRYALEDGTVVKTTKTAEIPESEMFFVALGDLTVGTRSSEGRALLEASGQDFEDTYVTGRGAFYLKGKIKGRYLLTASMDTTEDDIDNLFSNLSDKDPQSVLRRIDPDRYYPVYGDNSTYVEDAPTQGRFYVRLEDGDDHIVWGNFFTNVTDTEFAQIDRGLYGAKAEFNSDAMTEKGDRKLRATLFAADPGTVPGRQEFRATGGSVYFLENQDLTIGSERVRVEIRDQDSGLVLETRELRPFVDYEIDYIQGRVMLSAPLSSTELGDQIVRDGIVSGSSVYLVARYEYTQAFTDIDGYSSGGRVETWVNDDLRFGLTGQSEETGDADQTLLAADLLMEKSPSTYFKAEIAQTEGEAFDERASLDGGFTFNPLSADASSDDEALAWRVEGSFSTEDLENPVQPAKVHGFYESLESGFSAPGRLTRADTVRYGAALETQFNDRTHAALKYDSVSITGALDEDTVAADLRVKVVGSWSLGAGIRHNDLEGPLSVQQGDRTDAGLELRNDVNEELAYYGFGQATVDVDGGRERMNRAGLGLETRLTENVQVKGEVSGGDGGIGALAGLTWQRDDGEEYYLNYTLDADRTEPGVDGTAFLPSTQNNLTVGGRRRFTDTVSVYGEERATFGDRAGLTHAYGLDFQWDNRWTLGASFEIGDIEEFAQKLEREAYTVTTGYADDEISMGAAFEWRSDDDGAAKRDTWLFRSNLGMKVSPDWTAILKYNKAESNFSGGAFFDGDFTEAQIAGAYRPTENDRLNALMRYTYFEELPSASQISNTGQTALPAQKSNIFSVDANYRMNSWLTLGGKMGYRDGEVSLSRSDDDFVENSASLVVARADIHFVKKWDALIEARLLEVDASQDSKAGVLAALYRHVGDNAKVGIGYNFTDFSDDLTDLSFDDEGLFLNVIAKF